jgi:hypothetical protein
MPTDKIPAEDGRLLQAPQLGGKRAGQACYRRTGHAEAAGHGNCHRAGGAESVKITPRRYFTMWRATARAGQKLGGCPGCDGIGKIFRREIAQRHALFGPKADGVEHHVYAACLPATSATWRSIAASSSASTDAVSATPPTAITVSPGAPLRPLRKTLAPSRAATPPRRPALRDEILNAAAA